MPHKESGEVDEGTVRRRAKVRLFVARTRQGVPATGFDGVQLSACCRWYCNFAVFCRCASLFRWCVGGGSNVRRDGASFVSMGWRLHLRFSGGSTSGERTMRNSELMLGRAVLFATFFSLVSFASRDFQCEGMCVNGRVGVCSCVCTEYDWHRDREQATRGGQRSGGPAAVRNEGPAKRENTLFWLTRTSQRKESHNGPNAQRLQAKSIWELQLGGSTLEE